MFSIDFPEIVIIFGVALVVLGPKKLPGAAAQIGRWVGRARAMARQFREQLEQEVASAENALDIRKSFESATREPPPNEPAAAPGTREPPNEPTEPAGTAPHVPPFDAQLHDTALPSGGGPPDTVPVDAAPHEPVPAGGAPHDPAGAAGTPATDFEARAPAGEATALGMQAWMPETQTWMAGVGWEQPGASTAEARVADRPPGGIRSQPSPESNPTGAPSLDAAQPERTERVEAVEHGGR